MGRSASASVIYGIGWEGETAPPSFKSEYGDWDYEAALTAFPATPYSDPMDEESWDEYEWLEALLGKLGVTDVLSFDANGYGEEPGYCVHVTRVRQRVGDYGMMDLSLAEPNEVELAAIRKVADVLGYTEAQVGWKLYAYYS